MKTEKRFYKDLQRKQNRQTEGQAERQRQTERLRKQSDRLASAVRQAVKKTWGYRPTGRET